MSRPSVTLKFASSLDGCLDDRSPERRIFSSPEDRKAVYALRSEFDAILIGAETLRKDRPRLTLEDGTRGPERIILTVTGNIPKSAPLFNEGESARIIYTIKKSEAKIKALGLAAEVRPLGKDRVALPELLEDLSKRGVKSLLVEGGASVLAEFLSAGLFDRLRVAVAPEIIADKRAPRVVPPKEVKGLVLKRANRVGAMTVLEYKRS